MTQPVRILELSPFDWTVEVNGHDLSPALRGFSLDAQAGQRPRLELDLDAIHVDRLDLDHALVVIPDRTHDALIALGWTPPGKATPPLVSTETSLVEPCPECAAGKCSNCDGGSWDRAADQPAACPCSTDGHPRRTA